MRKIVVLFLIISFFISGVQVFAEDENIIDANQEEGISSRVTGVIANFSRKILQTVDKTTNYIVEKIEERQQILEEEIERRKQNLISKLTEKIQGFVDSIVEAILNGIRNFLQQPQTGD